MIETPETPAPAPKAPKAYIPTPLQAFVIKNVQRHQQARFGKHQQPVWIHQVREKMQKHLPEGAMFRKSEEAATNPLRTAKNTLQNKYGMSGRQWVRLRKAVAKATRAGEAHGLLSSTDA